MNEVRGHNESSEITLLLTELRRGDAAAVDRLMPLVYEELKDIARSRRRWERADHTLNTTGLVHEAYMKLAGQDRVEWQSRAHFFAVASEAMRRILVNYARDRRAQKRGAGAPHVALDEDAIVGGAGPSLTDEQADDLLELESALQRLADFNERGATVVGYRFFGGMSYEEIAEVLGLSVITVRRAWELAKTWLRRELGDERAGRAGALIASPN